MRRSNARALTRRKSTPKGRALSSVIAATAVIVTTLGVGSEPASAADAIESHFQDAGEWEDITWDDGTNGCADGVAPTDDFTLVYPTDLGDGGYDHPIIVWGNGTGVGNPDQTCSYEPWLTYLASWGFVVVAPNTGESGTGDEMVLGAAAAVWENASSSSIFYQQLDTSSIAASGHSQGAVGAINATLDGNGLFTSVLPIGTPNRDALDQYNLLCVLSGTCNPVPVPLASEMNQLGAPIFFVRGTGLHNDPPCEEDDWMSNQTPTDWHPTAAVPFAGATVQVEEPTDPNDCGTSWPLAPYPHFPLAEARGYVTAWFAYTLTGDSFARAAFVGSPPEIETNTPRWEQVDLENLP